MKACVIFRFVAWVSLLAASAPAMGQQGNPDALHVKPSAKLPAAPPPTKPVPAQLPRPAADVVVELPADFSIALDADAPGRPYYLFAKVPANQVPRFTLNRLYNSRLQFVKSLHGLGGSQEAVADYVVKVPVSDANRASFAPLFAKAPKLADLVSNVWVRGTAVLSTTGFPLRKLDDFTPVLMQLDAGFFTFSLAYEDTAAANAHHAKSEPMLMRGAAGKVLPGGTPAQAERFRDTLLSTLTRRLEAKPFSAPIEVDLLQKQNEVRFERSYKPSQVAGAPYYERAVYILDLEEVGSSVYAYLDVSLALATGIRGDYMEPDLSYPQQLAQYKTALQSCFTAAVKTTCLQLKGTFQPTTCSCKLPAK